MRADTGNYSHDARTDYPIYSSPEAWFEYSVWSGLEWSVVGGLSQPSGLALSAEVVYVASHSSGIVHAFKRSSGRLLQVLDNVPGVVSSLSLNQRGELWLLDAAAQTVMQVDVTTTCADTTSAGDDGVRQRRSGR